MTLDILSSMIANGNVYGALIVGLDAKLCKRKRLAAIHQRAINRYSISTSRKRAASRKPWRRGLDRVNLLAEAARCKREECDIAEIILGMECGGSDATSGLSSNIVLGYLSDRLVDLGATTVISETPEAIGAEQILARRGRTPEIGQKLYDTVKACEQLFFEAGEDIRKANPSPGNKAGGLTTLEENRWAASRKAAAGPLKRSTNMGR